MVPSPIRVVSNVARSIVLLAPTSTSFSIFEPAGVRDLHVPAVDLAVAESVTTQHAAGVDLDPVAENHILIEHGVGMNDAVAAELAALADDRAGMHRRSVADNGAFAHVGERINRHIRADLGRRGDTRPGDEFRSSALRCSPIKWVRTARKADIGSSTSMTARLCCHLIAPGTEVGADDRGRRGRARQELGEPIIFDERDVAGPRLADRPRRAYRDAAIADQATANQVPQVVPPLRPRAFSFLP